VFSVGFGDFIGDSLALLYKRWELIVWDSRLQFIEV